MTVSSTARKQSFTLDGVTDEFTFTFRALTGSPTDIKCLSTTGGTDTILAYTTDYTVAVNSNGVGGTVTLVDAAAVGSGTLTVYRETTNTQASDYDDYNQFPANTLENDMDIRTLISQEQEETQDRALRLPISASSDVSTELPSPSASKLIGWNATADALENYTPNSEAYLTKATQSQAEAGTDDSAYMTPLGTTKVSPILDSTPDADHSAKGIKTTLTANEAQTFGDVCFINSSGKAQLADADAIATASAICMCVSSTVAADGTGSYLLLGVARDDSWTWTAGVLIFLSTTGTTGGTLTMTAPSGTDDVIQVVGIATHADRMFFNPSLTQVEHT